MFKLSFVFSQNINFPQKRNFKTLYKKSKTFRRMSILACTIKNALKAEILISFIKRSEKLLIFIFL